MEDEKTMENITNVKATLYGINKPKNLANGRL